MRNKVVLITGGNSGIGRATAIELARRGARVVFTSRDPDRGREALEAIRAASGGEVSCLPLDLARLSSVEALAETFARGHDRLDVLINNAGVVLSERQVTPDGYEMTFQVNHLGHFLLTRRLLEVLSATPRARVINVSSMVHRAARSLDWDDLQSERRYVGFLTYCRSKLANLLFTRELSRRVREQGVTVNALHPGTIASGFARDGDTRGVFAVGAALASPFLGSPERGAALPVRLATAEDLADVTGAYFERGKLRTPSAAARDEAAARRLWDVSERLVGSRVNA
jgi:NAD(P)-dependent dehydrogenase (short-subunit alcohol dehydrogenase family)